jgi:hypothetical protein
MIGSSSTLLLVSTLVYLFAAGVAALAKLYDARAPGLISWAIAMLMASFGNFLLYTNRADPHSFLLVGAGTLSIASYAAMWAGLRRHRLVDTARAMTTIAAVSSGAAFLAVVMSAYSLWPMMESYSLVFALFGFTMTALLSWEAWRHEELSRLQYRRITAWGICGMAVSYIMRVAAAGLALRGAMTPEAASGLTRIARYLTTISVLVATMGLAFSALAGDRRRAN